MNRRLTALLLAAAVLASCFSERGEPAGIDELADCSLPLDSSTIGNVGVVVIRDFAYHPAELRVQPGTRVVFINCETEANQRTAHTATADNNAWGSPLLSFEGTYTAVMGASGTFDYHCEPHPSMRGRIIVE